MSQPSLMLREALQSPDVVARLLLDRAGEIAEIGRWFAAEPPVVVSLAARGSSDHAATFFKYLMEARTGIPTASIGPSIASIYKAPLKLASAVHFTISQSGASPDIVALQAAAKQGGARTVAIVNVPDSPVGREADVTIALGAGDENSVAATKSFIGSAAALAAVAAAASKDTQLARGVAALPDALAKSAETDTGALSDWLVVEESLFVCGRGAGLGIALESALKAKETAGQHAEAFSTAEVMHGPTRLVQNGFPIIAYVPEDEVFAHNRDALDTLIALGGRTAVFSSVPLGQVPMIVPSTGCGLIDPLVALLPYYRMIETVTRMRGFDPDKPRNLKKVTETV